MLRGDHSCRNRSTAWLRRVRPIQLVDSYTVAAREHMLQLDAHHELQSSGDHERAHGEWVLEEALGHGVSCRWGVMMDMVSKA